MDPNLNAILFSVVKFWALFFFFRILDPSFLFVTQWKNNKKKKEKKKEKKFSLRPQSFYDWKFLTLSFVDGLSQESDWD